MRKNYILPFISIILLLVCSALFYLINANTPMVQDDYWLNFVIKQNPDGTWEHTTKRISSLYELFVSWYHHRSLILNGRIADYIGAFVMMKGGKELFNIINTLAFFSYILIYCKLCFNKVSPLSILLLLSASFFVLPSFNLCHLWISGACNYFWGGIAFGLFIYLFEKLKSTSKTSVWFVAATAASAFICGTINEGMGLPLTLSLACFGVYTKLAKREVFKYYWIIFIFSLLGTLIPMSAPAMWNRAGSLANAYSPLEICIVTLMAISKLWNGAGPALILAVLAWLRNRKNIDSFLFFYIVINTGIVSILCTGGVWGGFFFYLNLAILIYVLQSFKSLIENEKLLFISFSTIYVCQFWHNSYAESLQVNQLHNKILDSITPQTCGGVVIQADKQPPWFVEKSFPESPSDNKYIYCCEYLNKNRFWVFFQTCHISPSDFSHFDEEPSTSVCVRKINGKFFIRLPKKCFWDNYRIKAYNANSNRTLLLKNNKWSNSDIILASLRNRRLETLDVAYHNGFQYLILPSSIENYDTLTFKICTKNEYSTIITANKERAHTNKSETISIDIGNISTM